MATKALAVYKPVSKLVIPDDPYELKPVVTELILSISEVYLKIGTHWSPIPGNAAGEYGFGDLE